MKQLRRENTRSDHRTSPPVPVQPRRPPHQPARGMPDLSGRTRQSKRCSWGRYFNKAGIEVFIKNINKPRDLAELENRFVADRGINNEECENCYERTEKPGNIRSIERSI